MEQHAWAAEQAATNNTPFWRAMRLLLAQLQGLAAGYAQRQAHEVAQRTQRGGAGLELPELGLADFLFISAVGGCLACLFVHYALKRGASAAGKAQCILCLVLARWSTFKTSPPLSPCPAGDFDDVLAAVARERRRNWAAMTPSQLAVTLATSGKCSALVRVTGDFSDLLLAHSAWYTFGGMVRVYKHFDFQLSGPEFKLEGASFSSYPGEGLGGVMVRLFGLSLWGTGRRLPRASLCVRNLVAQLRA